MKATFLYDILSTVTLKAGDDLDGCAALVSIEMSSRGYSNETYSPAPNVRDIVDDEGRAVRLIIN